MATTYYGLTWWQWLVVVLFASIESIGVATSPGELVGAFIGAAIVVYLFIRLLAMVSRSVRSRVGERVSKS